MKAIISQINLIIFKVRPTKLVYLAIDGPAVMAKMVQQRERRYKSYKSTKELQEIRDFHNNEKEKLDKEELDKTYLQWDSNQITPGTEFIRKVSKELHKYYLHSLEGSKEIAKLGNKVKVIISDADEPGEGEHKIFDHIRSLKKIWTRYSSLY